MDKIAVLVPCYNEEKTIEKVVLDAKKALPEAVIYVYDNNSSDRTVELAKKVLWFVMNTCREKAMSSAECSARLTRSVISWWMVMIRILWNMLRRW